LNPVLAIDQGTSGTKAIVVDPGVGVLSAIEVALRPSYLPNGGVEQDPQQLLSSVLDAGRRAVAAAGCSVTAVALANQGETVLAWDPVTGQPHSPAIVCKTGGPRPYVTSCMSSASGSPTAPGWYLIPTSPHRKWRGYAGR